jgi:hypothetical protein
MKTETIRKVAETIAGTLIDAEKEIRTEAEQVEWDWWLNFLRQNGQARLWRKALLTKHILLAESEE